MIVVDAHQDIAYNRACFGRDYRMSALKKRLIEAQAGHTYPAATLGLPEALAGRIAIVFATLFVAPKNAQNWTPEWREEEYETPHEAYELALRQWDYYQQLTDESDQLRLIRNQADLTTTLDTWGADKTVKDRRQGLVILMEGADPILEPRQFEEWYERGVRIVGLAWNQTRYSGGTGAPGKLSALGEELLEVMGSFNALLDLSHSSELAFYQSLDRYTGPIIASHSNPRRFRDTDRHLSDDMIRRLAERDGVMGIVPYNRFLSPTWQKGDPKSSVPLTVMLDAIDHVCQVTGSADHVGIGSDLDGGFGYQSIPYEMDTVADLWRVGEGLRGRGYPEASIEAVMGGNMLRKLRECLK
ncbi:MAG: membrane dipeptidase [Anaerolineae bacterium]|jgi:membrane dipeptidase|nr:membrane dipeptidase [Anaerolineae bacterium]